MMIKLDLRKDLKYLYAPSAKTPQIVEVPAFNYVMIDGGLGPGETPDTSPAMAQAMGALYAISYGLKFMSKLRPVDPIDYPVMALEGQWWVESGEFSYERQDNWRWTLLMLQPDHVTPEMFADARRQAEKKRPSLALAQVRWERLHEGTCVQVMHLGPYSAEPPTIERMHAYARAQGYDLRGKHHEIYLSDPRRAAPEKMKTVLRMPVQKAG
jgi:hypothetical protein